MTEPADNNAEWVQQWIAQQRAFVEKLATAGGADAGVSDSEGAATGAQPADLWGLQWSQLGNSYLSGMLKSLSGIGVNGADGPPPGETFDAWRNAWTNALAQLSAPGGWADLVNRSAPLGLFREQTEAWRAVASAQADCQRLEQEFAAVLRRVQTDALTLLESRVQALAESGSPIQGLRELYDLWIDCSEQVFNTVAHSSAYGHLQGEMTNAALRLRARVQRVIEQGLRQFDLPTRSELNSVHQQLRQLRQRLDEMQRTATVAVNARAAKAVKPAPRSSSQPTASAGRGKKKSVAASSVKRSPRSRKSSQ